MIRNEPITEKETCILIEKINKEKASSPKQLLYMFIFINLFIFLSGKNRKPSLYNEYGYWKPAIIMTLLFSGLHYSSYRMNLKNLQMDLDSKEKIVATMSVLKKDKSFFKGEYQIWIDSEIKDFKKYQVDAVTYNQIEKGHKVIVEYGKMSKTLYKIDFNIA